MGENTNPQQLSAKAGMFVLTVLISISVCLLFAAASSLWSSFELFNFHYLDEYFDLFVFVENGVVPSFIPSLIGGIVLLIVALALLRLCKWVYNSIGKAKARTVQASADDPNPFSPPKHRPLDGGN